MNDSMHRDNCDRCQRPVTNGKTFLSYFNKQVICEGCKSDEKSHADYNKAVQADIDSCKKGNFNFDGIGLPEDLKILAIGRLACERFKGTMHKLAEN